jgi:hypothetical protein
MNATRLPLGAALLLQLMLAAALWGMIGGIVWLLMWVATTL